MTKEQKVEMFRMKLDGFTFQEIGAHFGITKQRVQQILDARPRRKKAYNYYFKNLAEWMVKNNITTFELSEQLDCCYGTLLKKLNGVNQFTISEINSILKLTGMAYEKAFAVDEKASTGDKQENIRKKTAGEAATSVRPIEKKPYSL